VDSTSTVWDQDSAVPGYSSDDKWADGRYVLARISHPVRRVIHLARGDGSSHSLQIALSVGWLLNLMSHSQILCLKGRSCTLGRAWLESLKEAYDDWQDQPDFRSTCSVRARLDGACASLAQRWTGNGRVLPLVLTSALKPLPLTDTIA
jgi:hypothetical protein